MIDRGNTLSISRQAQLVGINRDSVYYRVKPVSTVDLELMRQIDELHLEYPFMGARMLHDQLNRKGSPVARKRISTTRKRMGIEAVYKRPRTNKNHPGHKIYPYLLRNVQITEPNQVWALDTTYIPMAKGFFYLTVVADWASRKVLAAKIAITLESCHAVNVLQEAFAHHGTPKIVNTDQGGHFIADEFVQAVKNQDCQLSMDGRGAWRDNVIVKRLWKSLKYERVYLYAYDSVNEARKSITQYMDWYNTSRPHFNLGKKMPEETYATLLPDVRMAA